MNSLQSETKCFWCDKPVKYIAGWSYAGYGEYAEYTQPVCEEHVDEDHPIWDNYLYWGDYEELEDVTT